MEVLRRIPAKAWPLIILATLGALALLLFSGSPETQRRPPSEAPRITVDVVRLSAQRFDIEVESYGTVQPRTQSLLIAQTSGQVIKIGRSFRDGGFFNKGDLLLQIDPRDARANVKIAEATLLDARQALQEENARSKQAMADWTRLGRTETPSDLVLRKPQLLAAQARLVSAEANLDKAKLALERTQITAPYDGRVLRQIADLGQVVSMGTQLGELYASDRVEVRLPIRNRDLAFIDLPESYSDSKTVAALPVRLESELRSTQSWDGEIVRTESAIDQSARQLHVVAEIDEPFRRNSEVENSAPIKIGQYVTARIKGKTLESAIVIPETSIYQNSFVYIVENDTLQRRNISILWRNGSVAVISDGLVSDDQLVLTPLGQVTSGTPVNVRPQS